MFLLDYYYTAEHQIGPVILVVAVGGSGLKTGSTFLQYNFTPSVYTPAGKLSQKNH